jgi:hypothetical protein
MHTVNSESGSLESSLEKAETLLDCLIRVATDGAWGEETISYKVLRADLLLENRLKTKLPDCVRRCRDIQTFWSFIKTKFSTYESRRQYLRAKFEPLLSMLESEGLAPSDQNVSAAIAVLDSGHVADAWRKALDRRSDDPEGAITAARTLLESVCKHILDARDVAYSDTDDLPKLYGMTAEQLNLAPNQHTEQTSDRYWEIANLSYKVSAPSETGSAMRMGRENWPCGRRHAMQNWQLILLGLWLRFLCLRGRRRNPHPEERIEDESRRRASRQPLVTSRSGNHKGQLRIWSWGSKRLSASSRVGELLTTALDLLAREGERQATTGGWRRHTVIAAVLS